jgi:hypothetical protein
LRLVDLVMRMQPAEWIVADRPHGYDLLIRIARGLSTSTSTTAALNGRSRDRLS